MDRSSGLRNPAHASDRRSRVYFTIVSRNYISYAATLMQSLETVDPHSSRFVILADEPGGFSHLRIPADLLLARDIGIPTFDDMTLRYQIMELNTAVKPYAFRYFFERYPESIISYIDPDIVVLRRLTLVEDQLEQSNELALTPHITRPLRDGLMPDDMSIMKSGVWNLGFAAFRRSEDTERLVDWWADRCRTDCRSSVEENIFTDQRWMDMAPSFVARTAIIRDPGYNLAYWNLSHRSVAADENGITVEGGPITFVHFSGIVPDNDAIFSKHQNRFSVENIGALRILLDDYRGRLLANDWETTSRLPYAYGYSPDGRRMHDLSRRYFRALFTSPPTRADLRGAAYHGNLPDWTDDAEPSLLALGPPYLPRIVFQCWKERSDLHAHFAPLTPEGRRGLLSWFENSARREFGVDDLSLDRAKRVAKFGPGVGATARLRWPAVANSYAAIPSANVVSYLSENVEFKFDDQERVELPRAFALLWEQRRDLQNAFPLATREEWRAYLRWCYETGPLEGSFDKTLLSRTIETFRSQQTAPPDKSTFANFDAHVRYGYDGSFGALNSETDELDDGDKCALTAYYVFRYARRLDWPDDFTKAHVSLLCAPAPGSEGAIPLTRLMRRIYDSRPDLRRAFDVGHERGALAFIGWFLVHGFQEYALDERVLDVRLRGFLTSPRLGQLNNAVCAAWALAVPDGDLRDRQTYADIVSWYQSGAAKDYFAQPVFQTLRGVAQQGAETMRASCAVSGYVGSASGRGEDVRMTKRALEAVGINPLVIDRARQPDRGMQLRKQHQTAVEINIGHFNAESAYLDNSWHRTMGVRSRYSVGYWAWELAKFPEEWTNAFLFYDEIWASTEFARAAFASVSPRPVHLMPMVVENPAVDPSLGRAHFALPSDTFLYFFHFDFRSFVHRKNPEAAIRAFLQAFPHRGEPVGLVIKTINAEHDSEAWERVRLLVSSDERIKIVNKEMSRVEVTSLIAASDCYVSLHRSEGFGRGLAEAMLLDKPVIATGYSGNMDFCSPDTAFLVEYNLVPVREHEYVGTTNQVWADASVDHAASMMRTVFENESLRRSVALRGAANIRTKYSADVVGAQYGARLREIVSTMKSLPGAPPRSDPTAEQGRSAKAGWPNLFGALANKKR